MSVIQCTGFKKTPDQNIKIKATWLGNTKTVVKQFLVSFLSYLKYPFSKKKDGAAKKYFASIYDQSVKDDLIFDGHSSSYLEKVKLVVPINSRFDCIYDCGCGEASFLNFIKQNMWQYNRYIGIDYAIQPCEINSREELVKSDIVDYKFQTNSENSLFVFANVFCYMSDTNIINILNKINTLHSNILIVDPIPGLFWDATFAGVRLFYRSRNQVDKLLSSMGFVRKTTAIDYFIKKNNFFVLPLSYATYYEFKGRDE